MNYSINEIVEQNANQEFKIKLFGYSSKEYSSSYCEE